MKKILALLLAFMMLAGINTLTFAHDFTDITGHWAEEEIEKAFAAGIVNGDGNGLFRPDDTVTRAEYTKMLVATILPLYSMTEEDLDDMYQADGHWCTKYYFVGVDSGIFYPDEESTVTTGDGAVNPGVFSNVTADYKIERWEMAYLTFNMAYNFGDKNTQTADFGDNDAIQTLPELVSAGISICASNGIIKGDDLGNFNPHKNGTRAEAVVMINRLNNLIKPAIDASKAAQEQMEAEMQAKLKTYSDSEIPKENVKVQFTMENEKSFTMELYPEYAPQTVANFVSLVNDGFYDGLTFHRVVEGFMAQGGDPDGDGSGGPDHLIKGEFSANGFTQNTLSHTRGTVSMARSKHYDSAGSQFFICYDDAISLDGQYAAFGKVISGMEVVDEFLTIERKTSANGELSSPTTPIVIKTAKVIQ